MEPTHAVRIQLRRLLGPRTPRRLLRRRAFQLLFGLHLRDHCIVDRLLSPPLEYDLDSLIGRSLFFYQEFERAECSFFSARLAAMERPVVLDVGANIGVHSLVWARSHPHARVYAFEPSPATSAILARNVNRAGVADRVTIVRAAISAGAGAAEFFECQDGAFSSLRITGRSPITRRTMVETESIDGFTRKLGLPCVSLIKIDVEGLEASVLEGAIETVSRHRPDLFVEIYKGDNPGADPERTIGWLLALGYEAWTFTRRGLQPYRGHSDEFYNYFFRPGAR